MSVSAFASVTKANIDEHVKLSEMFVNDHNSRRICLFSNVHYDEYNKIHIFPAVERCLKIAIEDGFKVTVESSGIEEYCQLACEFVLGSNSKAIAQNRCFGVQTISSIGALRLGAQFLREKLSYTTYCSIYPDCRGIYNSVFIAAGFGKGFTLRMPEIESNSFKRFLSDLERVPDRSVLVIGICGIGSTGLDPSMLEWFKIARIIDRKKLFPFFDATFQGLVSGEVDLDAYPVRYLEQSGFELFIAQDFSFNMGLVSERPGNLCVVLKSASLLKNTKITLSEYMRVSCFTPPALGAHVVSKILSDIDLRDEYYHNLKAIVLRNENMRNHFMCNLRGLCRRYDWVKYENQMGLYVNIELNPFQIERLRNEYHIYVPNGGWFCLAGLSSVNMTLFCRRIFKTIMCGNIDEIISSSGKTLSEKREDVSSQLILSNFKKMPSNKQIQSF